MQNFSKAELERLQTYINMANAVHTHRELSVQIREKQINVQSWSATLTFEYNAQLKQDLKDLIREQIQGERDMAITYGVKNPRQLLNQMRAIENEFYPRIVEHSPMRDTFETMFPKRQEQRLQDWKQPARTPEDQADRTVQYAKEAMQAEQEYRRQHGTPGGDGTPPGNQGEPNLGRERRLFDDEYERQFEKQPPAQDLSQDEQNRQNVARKLDAQYGIGEAEKLNEQKLDFEDLYRRPSKQPRPRGPERSGPEM